MMAYTEPQQWKKESGRLTGEGDKIKFIYLRFERRQVVRFRKARRLGIYYHGFELIVLESLRP